MDYRHLKVERRGRVAVVTFNRPEKANALNARHIEEIEHAALSLRDDAETRAVVFTGAGRHFTSGADLTEPEPAPPPSSCTGGAGASGSGRSPPFARWTR